MSFSILSRRVLSTNIKTHRLFFNFKFFTTNPAAKMTNIKFDKEISPEICDHFTNKFVPIEKQTFYCKDSRGDYENFGAPGGDFGEFLLALDCFKKTGKRNSEISFNVDGMFEKWLKERCSKGRPFYLHSDRPALNKILKSIGKEEGSDLPTDPIGREKFIESFGNKSEFQGCGHLRLMLENPEGYSIDLDLFSQLSRAFFTRYFNGDERLIFKIYEIPQDGCALVVINGSVDMKNSVLSTQCKKTKTNHQVFILNQHAVSAFRKHFLVPFFVNGSGEQAEKMFEEMEKIGWRNAMMSANTLAGGKPIYKVDLIKGEQ